VFDAIKKNGVVHLVAASTGKHSTGAGHKALNAMPPCCVSLHLSDPATICKLFDNWFNSF